MAAFVFNTTRNPLPEKRERLTVQDSVVGITPSTYTIDGTEKNLPRHASAAVLQVLDKGIIWTLDGSDPDPVAGVGFEAAAGDYIYLDSLTKIEGFRAIQAVSQETAQIEVLPLWGN